MPQTKAPKVKRPTASCLEDDLLLAIARGTISEPALSHYLSHLEDCLWCCQRSIELERSHPGPVSRGVRALLDPKKEEAKKGIVPPHIVPPRDEGEDLDNWLDTLRKLRSPTSVPVLEKEAGSGDKTLFGHLQIQSVLGEGRSSVVYKAMDEELGRLVALKVLRPDIAGRPGMAESFLHEARALASVRDPHLVILHKYSKFPSPHLEMELLKGRSLATALSDGPISSERAVRLVGEIAQGLSRLHEAGIVHRDVKPANIWLANDQPGDRAVLLDLGLVGESNLGAGSRGYRAPEVNELSPPEPKSDIYALGLVLRVMAMGAESGLATRGKCPPELSPLIDSMIRLNPGDRPSAKEVANLANRWLRKRGATRRMVLRGLVGAGLVGSGIVAGLGFWWTRPAKTHREVEVVPEGLEPFRTYSGRFAGQSLSDVQYLTLVDGRHTLICTHRVVMAGDEGKPSRTIPIPDMSETLSFRDGLLAFATDSGEVRVLDFSGEGAGDGKFPTLGTIFPKNNDTPVVSLSLSSREEGKLLIHCGPMVYLAERKNGIFSPTPVSLCHPEEFLRPTQGSGLVRLEFAPDPGNILAFSHRGGLLCSRLDATECLWGFRPDRVGPLLFSPRPGVGGAFAIGSPGGFVGTYGPGLARNGNLTPWPKVGPTVQLKGPVKQLEWVDSDRVAVLLGESQRPLFLADLSNPGVPITFLLSLIHI